MSMVLNYYMNLFLGICFAGPKKPYRINDEEGRLLAAGGISS